MLTEFTRISCYASSTPSRRDTLAMGNIIALNRTRERATSSNSRAKTNEKPAEIVIFPGVRYERMAPSEGAPGPKRDVLIIPD